MGSKDCIWRCARFGSGAVARRIDTTDQGRFGDNPAPPYGMQKIVLADNTLAILHQMDEQVEDLRPRRDDLGRPGELPAIRVEHAISKYELHFDAP
jgi:hypothetical protein